MQLQNVFAFYILHCTHLQVKLSPIGRWQGEIHCHVPPSNNKFWQIVKLRFRFRSGEGQVRSSSEPSDQDLSKTLIVNTSKILDIMSVSENIHLQKWISAGLDIYEI